LSLPIPANPSFAGIDLNLQGVTFGSANNPLGIELTGGAVMHLGLR
jgi:hypothetical protein